MKESWEKAIEFVLRWEGTYSNDPRDSGGVTIYGIAEKYHPREVAQMKELWKQGKYQECKEIAKQIYKRNYWDKIDGDNMPYPRDIILFDTAVNMGVGTALGFNNKYNYWELLLLARIQRYCLLAIKNTNLGVFLKGWLRRVLSLYDTIKPTRSVQFNSIFEKIEKLIKTTINPLTLAEFVLKEIQPYLG